jgi:arylsulfatase A-like enzyme
MHGAAKPMNIIILLNDDQGWGDLGVQGHPIIKTPTLDNLARTGCLLPQFYVTAPECSPSRAGFLTGRIQNRYGMQNLINGGEKPSVPLFEYIPPNEPMLPRLLHQAGYTTAHLGKWHCSFPTRPGVPTMIDNGYDFAKILNAGRNVSYFSSKWDVITPAGNQRIQSKDKWSADVYVDDAINFIEKSGDKPFFINLWSFAPHQFVEASDEFRAVYKDRSLSEQYYLGAVTQMDAAYKRLMDYLDKKGLTDHTIIVFFSDNGPEPHLITWSDRARGSTGGLRGGKHALYEGGIRVPCIIRWPGVTTPGSVCKQVVWSPDITATLCAAAHVAPPKDYPFDGIDLRPALEGKPLNRRVPLYWQYPWSGVGLTDGSFATSPPLALRDGSWKILCDDHFENVELYDLDLDMNEKWNMRDDYPKIAARLLAELQARYKEINGPYSREADTLSPLMKFPAGKKKSDYPVYTAPGLSMINRPLETKFPPSHAGEPTKVVAPDATSGD